MIFGGFIEVQVRKGLKLGFPRFWAGFNPFLAKLLRYVRILGFWGRGFNYRFEVRVWKNKSGLELFKVQFCQARSVQNSKFVGLTPNTNTKVIKKIINSCWAVCKKINDCMLDD